MGQQRFSVSRGLARLGAVDCGSSAGTWELAPGRWSWRARGVWCRWELSNSMTTTTLPRHSGFLYVIFRSSQSEGRGVFGSRTSPAPHTTLVTAVTAHRNRNRNRTQHTARHIFCSNFRFPSPAVPSVFTLYNYWRFLAFFTQPFPGLRTSLCLCFSRRGPVAVVVVVERAEPSAEPHPTHTALPSSLVPGSGRVGVPWGSRDSPMLARFSSSPSQAARG